MVGHQSKAYQGVCGCTCRGDNGVDEHTFFKCACSNDECLFQVAHIQGDDGALGIANFETFLLEAFQSIAGNLPQGFQTLRLCLHDAECFACRCSSGRSAAGAEDVCTCGVAQIVDDGLVGSNETTYACQTLGEGTHDEVHLVCQTEVVAHATAVAAEDTDTMCLVHHDGCIVLVLQFHDFWEFAQVTFHGEYTVNDNQFYAVRIATLEHSLQVCHVVVLETQLGGKTQSSAVND